MMGSSAVVHDAEKRPASPHEEPERLETDLRWQIAQRVVASRHFARSPLLSKFLLYIVAETIEGRTSEITEHQIGVRVFDRPISYRTVEDNIVRTYARQMRRRLADYFSGEGTSESLHIDIPLGGYIPVFLPAPHTAGDGKRSERLTPISIRTELPGVAAEIPEVKPLRRRPLLDPLPKALLFVLYTAVIFCAAWLAAARVRPALQVHETADPARPLWAAMFGGPLSTYIVPADAGLNLIEDLAHHPVPLSNYINGSYAEIPLPQVDGHSADDLRSQHFTSFVDLQIVSALARLPEFNPERAYLRFPRDLRLDDLKNTNAIIIGSLGSNPWAALAENNANFRIVYRDGMQGATILNAAPQPGEAATYVSHWNEPAHETFALISCLPNLGGNGRLLVLQGLDVAGTQSAGETLFHPAAIAPILRKATRPDGTLRYFEVLLRSTSIGSSATGTQVIGSRIY